MLAAARLAADDESASGSALPLRARAHLHALDSLLDDLERLNLVDAVKIPAALEERLEGVGIASPPGTTVTRLIERVFEKQEGFIGPPGEVGDRRSANKGKAPGSRPGTLHRMASDGVT